jgi:hypothetical protein
MRSVLFLERANVMNVSVAYSSPTTDGRREPLNAIGTLDGHKP